jgi:anti-sigma factor RsiW
MSCRELVEVVTDYLERSLPWQDQLRFEAHLEECPDCPKYLDQMRLTIATIGHLREESLDTEAREQLLRAFRGWAATRHARNGSGSWS